MFALVAGVAQVVPKVSLKLDEPLEFVGLGAIVLTLGWGMYVIGKRVWRYAFGRRNQASFKVVAEPWGAQQGLTSGSMTRLWRRLSHWIKPQPQQGRMPLAWLIVIGLAGGAIAGSVAFKFLPNIGTRPSTVASSVASSVSFRLCDSSAAANCVIDGDTLYWGGVKIRLADIDSPEIFSPKCSSELALGQKAKHRLLDLVNAGPFEVVFAGGRDEDVYGRKLRLITRGGQSLGDTLIAEGLARRWDGARRTWC